MDADRPNIEKNVGNIHKKDECASKSIGSEHSTNGYYSMKSRVVKVRCLWDDYLFDKQFSSIFDKSTVLSIGWVLKTWKKIYGWF